MAVSSALKEEAVWREENGSDSWVGNRWFRVHTRAHTHTHTHTLLACNHIHTNNIHRQMYA